MNTLTISKPHVDTTLVKESVALYQLIMKLDDRSFISSNYYRQLNMESSSNYILQRDFLVNPAMIMTFFYMLLILPKEILSRKDKNLGELYDNINIDIRTGHLCSFEKSSFEDDYFTIDYIGHIKNAIAHSQAKVVNDESFTYLEFYNYRNKAGNKQECLLRMSLENAILLLDQLMDINDEYCRQ